MEIVLDKSYLQGAPAETIRRLCEDHSVLFTETLFYELLTTSESERKACFAKLPAKKNPVALIPRVGVLLRYEIQRRQSSSPVIRHRLPESTWFNPEFSTGDFRHPPHEEDALENWRLEIEHEVKTFHDVATGVSTWCPDLRTLSGDALKAECAELKRQACVDTRVVRGIYNTLADDDVPPASLLDPSWALFRWLQVHLLYSLDHISRYGFASLEETPKLMQYVEHNIHDLQYVIFGSLCGTIATQDKAIAHNFTLAVPDGHVLRYVPSLS